MKPARRRVEVNLDELDQIIDRSTRAPLSESEGQKLKTALHAMAERLVRKRNTEKANAVLPPDGTPTGTPETSESAPAGHGRNSAAAFQGANRVAIAHATLHSGDMCPECPERKVYRQDGDISLGDSAAVPGRRHRCDSLRPFYPFDGVRFISVQYKLIAHTA